MNRVLIAAAARTPVGRRGGTLKELTEQELAALAMQEALKRAGLGDGESLDEVIVGVARQTSLPSNCARHSALLAGIPDSVPAYTVQQQSASGLQAIINGFFSIRCGDAQLILAGGTESASQTPMEILNARYQFNRDTEIVFDPIRSQQIHAQPPALYGEITMAGLAEEAGWRCGIRQERIDRFAAESRRKLVEHGCADGCFPVEVRQKKTVIRVADDEIAPDDGTIAPPGDGASMCVLADSRESMEKRRPVMAEILSIGMAAASPYNISGAAVSAAERALEAARLDLGGLDFVEIHELSAAHALAVVKGLHLPETGGPEVNPWGGALAQGSPWGAAGAILAGKTARRIAFGEGRRGMVVMPAEGGQGLALILGAWNEGGVCG